MSRIPGLRFDAKAGVAHFDIRIAGRRSARRRGTALVSTLEDAMRAFAAFREEQTVPKGSSGPVAAGAMTFGRYVEMSKARIFGRVAKTTRQSWKHRLPNLTRHLDNVLLQDIDRARVRDLADRLRARGLSPGTVNSNLTLLRILLRDAVENHELDRSHLPEKWPFRPEEMLALEMTDAELREFVKAAKADPKWGPLLVLAVETGLAKADLFSLEWGHVFDDSIRKQRQKTGVSSIPPLTNDARWALDQARKNMKGPLVFHGPDGQVIQSTALDRAFLRIKRKAGITRRLRIHDLRHTFGCRLGRNGVDPFAIARAMGHKSLKSVERYVRTDDRVSARILAALQPAPPTAQKTRRKLRIAGIVDADVDSGVD